MNRISWLFLAVLAVFPGASATAAEKPNVLLICIDDLKPLLGCYGDGFVKSPHIDRLAGRSMKFDSAYCNQAVCAPSRNALMTGLRPQTLGIYDLGTNFRKSRPDAVTVAQYFMNNGYRSEALGKIMHVGHGNREDAASWSVQHWTPKRKRYLLEESEKGMRMGRNGPRGPATESADVADADYADGAIADEAIARLKAAKKQPGKPFFLAVGFMKPHLPFVAPKKYWELYDSAAVPLAKVRKVPAGAPSYAPQFGGELRQYSDIPAKGPVPPELERRLVHGYHAATSYVDAQIGRVLTSLDELGLAKNTIIVLWGDHGWHLGDHGMWCKHTNYQEAARIPLLIARPGQTSGQTTDSMVETVDLYPTLCELAGLPVPGGLDGLSQVPVLEDPAKTVRDHVIHVYPRGKRLGSAIRTARHRLVEWKAPGAPVDEAEFELYDYEKDPLETKNVAASEPEVMAQMRKILARHPEAKPQIAGAGKPAKPRKARK